MQQRLVLGSGSGHSISSGHEVRYPGKKETPLGEKETPLGETLTPLVLQGLVLDPHKSHRGKFAHKWRNPDSFISAGPGAGPTQESRRQVRPQVRQGEAHVHTSWHGNVWRGISTSRPWMGRVCGGLSCLQQPAPLVSQHVTLHVPSHPAATDPMAPTVHSVTVRARCDAPCEPLLGVLGSGNATRGSDPCDACAP